MKFWLRIHIAFAALLVSLSLVPWPSARAQAAATDEDQLRALLADYAKSVNSLDLDLVGQIWSHDAGVSFIHPRGTEIGFSQIEQNFYKGTMGLFSERELTLEKPGLHICGESAWSEMTWTFHATFKSGQKITTTGRETQVYHKENGSWRIVHVHYSGPPITGNGKGF